MIALSFHGLEMDHDRACLCPGLLQHGTDRFDIIAVGRAQIPKAHQLKDAFLEDRAAQPGLDPRYTGDEALAVRKD